MAPLRGKPITSGGMPDDVAAWQHGMPRSLISDPRWHFAWHADLARASGCFMWTPRNSRLQGPDLFSGRDFPTPLATQGISWGAVPGLAEPDETAVYVHAKSPGQP